MCYFITPRFTGHKRNADFDQSAFNDEVVLAKAARLLWSFVKAVVKSFNAVSAIKIV